MHVPNSEAPSLDEAIDQLVQAQQPPLVQIAEVGIGWKRTFITNQRGEILAGEYERGEDSVGWVLPSHGGEMQAWLRLFLQRIHQLNPERVPSAPPDWSPWDTAAEAQIKQTREAIETELDAIRLDYQSKLDAIEAELQEVSALAEAEHRRLLSADGDDLKDAVADALSVLGLKVTDADDLLDQGEGKREDLWIEFEGDTGIAEVKGYRKGASSNDLMRAKDYAVTFAEKHGTRPARQWHIVNAFRVVDPGSRPQLFAGAADIVSAFGGLVIDTRDLFRLLRDVELGATSKEEAGQLLWETEPGFFSYGAESS
jgi:hypothetical protein